MILNIKKPYIKIENNKIMKNNNQIIELNDELLKIICEQKLSNWSKVIIDYIERNNLIDNIKAINTTLIQKDNFPKRMKKRSSTIFDNNSAKVKIINKYLNNL